MTFFLIVPSVIIIGAFLIHGAFNRVGLRIHFGALVICVVLSIMANAGTMMFSSVPDKFYFLRLGGLILTSALIGTLANYFFVRREILEQEKFSEEVQIAYQEKSAVEDEETPPEKVDEKEEVEAEKISVPIKKVDLVKKNLPKKKTVQKKVAVSEEKSDTKKIPEVKKVVEVKKTVEPAEIKPVKPVQKPLTAEKPLPAKVEPKKISTPVQKTQEKISERQEIQADVAFLSSAETLDDLLDLAYSEKSKGHIWQAITAYKKALEKYRGDNYAPFVAIDLGNLYKEQAMYAKAIKVFEDALELPAVKRSFSTTEKFQKNIIYLKAVQSVLLRHQELKTPFSKISKIYLQEIESEFQTAQLKINN